MEETAEQHLQEHGVRPTAVRILVWKTISQLKLAFTLNDVESMLPYTDRSSIFRTLKLFTENQLLHEIDDGLGSCKYCLCRCEHNDHLNHVHFSCTTCGKTYCLENQTIPVVQLPEGFVMNEVEYVMKGICPTCAKKQK